MAAHFLLEISKNWIFRLPKGLTEMNDNFTVIKSHTGTA